MSNPKGSGLVHGTRGTDAKGRFVVVAGRKVRLVEGWCEMCDASLGWVYGGQRFCPACRERRAAASHERARAGKPAREQEAQEAAEAARKAAVIPARIGEAARGCWAVYELWEEVPVVVRRARLDVLVALVLLRRIDPWEVDGLVPVALLEGAVEMERARRAAVPKAKRVETVATVKNWKKGDKVKTEERVCVECGESFEIRRHLTRQACDDCKGLASARAVREFHDRRRALKVAANGAAEQRNGG